MKTLLRVTAAVYLTYLLLAVMVVMPALNFLAPRLALEYGNRELQSELIFFNPPFSNWNEPYICTMVSLLIISFIPSLFIFSITKALNSGNSWLVVCEENSNILDA